MGMQLLHKNNILHLDYSPGNILIKEADGRHIFKIVDINRMIFKNLSLDERLKNFYMLWAKDEDMMNFVSSDIPLDEVIVNLFQFVDMKTEEEAPAMWNSPCANRILKRLRQIWPRHGRNLSRPI